MFEAFGRKFPADPGRVAETGALSSSDVLGFSELIAGFGGCSFAKGLYRVIRAADLERWNARVSLGFPEFESRICCFGYDWLGRCFAIDSQRREGGQPGVLMFEPGTGEVLEIPANVQTFHDEELIQSTDAALADDFHRRWLIHGGVEPAYAQCIGYRKPLFLGGADELENLELSELDVYWHLMGQLITKTKGLAPGTSVRFSMN